MPAEITSRRRFLHQTLAFSAASALLGPLTACGSGYVAGAEDPFETAHLLMVGDWGAVNQHSDQTAVAAAMQAYVSVNNLPIHTLLMLGDNFYGELGSIASLRWKEQFETMYPS